MSYIPQRSAQHCEGGQGETRRGNDEDVAAADVDKSAHALPCNQARISVSQRVHDMMKYGVRTRVALSNLANVSPTRIDNSSVAKANNCEVRGTRLMVSGDGRS